MLSAALFGTAVAQQPVGIGAKSRFINASEIAGRWSFSYVDDEKYMAGHPAYFIRTEHKTLGPYESLREEKSRSALSREEAWVMLEAGEDTYYSVMLKGKKYLVCNGIQMGPYKEAIVTKVSKATGEVAVVSQSKKGSVLEIFDPVSASKKATCPLGKNVVSVHMSDKMNYVVVYSDDSKDLHCSFMYDGVLHEGYWGASVEGWFNDGSGGETPVISCVGGSHSEENYDEYSELYLGNKRLAGNLRVVLTVDFNSTNTDFATSLYSNADDLGRVYTSKNVYGPYESVNYPEFDDQDRLTFRYDEKGKEYSWNASGEPTLLGENVEGHYFYVSDRDSVHFYDRDEDAVDVFYHGQKLFTSSPRWNNQTIWTKSGLVALNIEDERIAIYAYGKRLPQTVQRVLDVKESAAGELALAVSDSLGYYILRGDSRFGPYEYMLPLGSEGNTLQWSDDGSELIWITASEGQIVVWRNGEKYKTHYSLINFAFHKDMASSAVIETRNPACFLVESYNMRPIDDELNGGFPVQDNAQLEYENRRDSIADFDCVVLHFDNRVYPGYAMAYRPKFYNGGQLLFFDNAGRGEIILRKKAFHGAVAGDRVIYQDGDKVLFEKVTD